MSAPLSSAPADDLPVVGIVHGPDAAVSIPQILRAAAGLCRVRLFFREDTAAAASALVALGEAVAETAIYDLGGPHPRFGDAIEDLSGVVTFRDACIEDAEALADACNLVGGATGPCGRWRKDMQRRIFRAAGLAANDAAVVASAEELAEALRDLGAPGFLKPFRGTSSHNVVRIGDGPDATAAAEEAWRGMTGACLYETEIPGVTHPAHRWLGDYVSVETASSGSGRLHFAVTDKLPTADSVRETGDVAPSTLPEEWLATVLRSTDAALDALDVRNRITHTELKLTPTGPQVIEVNGRIGGYIEVAQTSIGSCFPTRMALEIALGSDPTKPMSVREDDFHVLVLCYPPPSGRFVVKSAPVLAAIRGLSGRVRVDRLRTSGDVVDTRAGSVSSIAEFWLEAPTMDDLRVRLEEALQVLRASVELDPPVTNPWLAEMLELLRPKTRTIYSR